MEQHWQNMRVPAADLPPPTLVGGVPAPAAPPPPAVGHSATSRGARTVRLFELSGGSWVPAEGYWVPAHQPAAELEAANTRVREMEAREMEMQFGEAARHGHTPNLALTRIRTLSPSPKPVP